MGATALNLSQDTPQLGNMARGLLLCFNSIIRRLW